MFTRRSKSPIRPRIATDYSSEKGEQLSEKSFKKVLQDISITTLKTPVVVFAEHILDEKLVFLYDGKIDTQAIYFMILERLQEMVQTSNTATDVQISEVIQLIKKKNLKNMYGTISVKLNLLKQVIGEIKFVPASGLILHKEGQNLSSAVLRPCHLTLEYFAQNLNKDENQSYKYNYFKDQICTIETKKIVEEKLTSLSKMKAEPKSVLVFPWPSKKELKEFSFRVLFEEVKAKRRRAIYCRSMQQAQSIKDNCISQRIYRYSTYIRENLADMVKIYKIKLLARFYGKFIKTFFVGHASFYKMQNENEAIQRILIAKYGPIPLKSSNIDSLKHHSIINQNQSQVLKSDKIKIAIEQSNLLKSGKPEKFEIAPASNNLIKADNNFEEKKSNPSSYDGYKNTDVFPDTKDDFRMNMRLNLNSDDESGPQNQATPLPKQRKPKLKLFNFDDNSHMALVERKTINGQQKIVSTTQRKLPDKVSVIKNSLFIEDFSKKKRTEAKIETIQNSTKLIAVDESFTWEKYCQNAPRVPRKLDSSPKNEEFLKLICDYSKVIISVRKLMLYNIARHHESNIDEADLGNLIFNFKMKSNSKNDSSLTFLKEVTQHCMIFSLDTSLIVDFEQMAEITFEMTEKTSSSVLFCETINFQKQFDSLYLENQFISKIDINLNGYDCSAVMLCSLVLVPMSLEVCHLTINKELLQANFARFGEMSKQIDSYSKYKTWFFPEAYKKSAFPTKITDLFISQTIFQNPNNAILETQENLYLSGHMNKLEFSLEQILQRASIYDMGALSFLEEMQEGFLNGYKNGLSVAWDLFGVVCDFMSSEERFFAQDYLFIKNKQYQLKTVQHLHDYTFQLSEVLKLIDKIDIFIAEVCGSLNCHEKYLLYQLCIDIYLFFENTNVGDSNLKFSVYHIHMILNVVRLNNPELSYQKLKRISLNQILSNYELAGYSKFRQLEYFDSCLLYFKLLLKTLFPEELKLISSFRISFDSLISEVLVSSFATCMDPISFGVYQDFKATLKIVFMELKEDTDRFLEKLAGIRINFSTLIDIVFALGGIVAEINFIVQEKPQNLLNKIHESFKKRCFEMQTSLVGVLKILVTVCKNGFYADNFEYMRVIVLKKHEKISKPLEEIQGLFQRTNFNQSLFKDFCEKEFLMKGAATKSVKKDAKKEAVNFKATEIGENKLSQEIRTNYKRLLYFLNEFEQLKSAKNYPVEAPHRLIKSSFLVEESQLFDILGRYFHISDSNSKILFNKLKIFVNKGKYNLVEIYLFLMLAILNDDSQIADSIGYLVSALTSIFSTSKQPNTMFIPLVHFILEKVSAILPCLLFFEYETNTILALDNKLIFIKQAQINIGNDMIDAHDIVQRFELDFYHKNKAHGLHFNFEFCDEIKTQLEKFADDMKVDLSFTSFILYLEFENKGTVQFFNVPFKLSFSSNLMVSCVNSDPIVFEDFESEKSLIPIQAFRSQVIKSPFFAFCDGTDIHFPMNFLEINFKLVFMKGQRTFLQGDFKFKEMDNLATFSNLYPWEFNIKEETTDELEESKTIEIDLPYQYFFLRLSELANLISIYLTQLLPEDDLFRFIIQNKSNYRFLTIRGEEVDKNTLLRNMVEMDEALKEKSEFVIIKKFD